MKARLIALLLLFALWASPGSAQAPGALPRVGVAGLPRPLSLRNAVMMALEKNRDLEIERAGVDSARSGLRRAQGAFDFVLGAGPFYRSERNPVNSFLAGGANGLLSQSAGGYKLEAGQTLPWGAHYQVRFDSLRVRTSNVFTQLNPQFSSGLALSFRQPLLRNRKIDEPRRQVLLRRKDLSLSEAQLRQRLIEVVHAVEQAYWDLVFARRDVEVKGEAVRLAETQEAMTRRRVDAGALARVEIVAAQAELERRREEFFQSVERITQAENRLKLLLAEGRGAPVWNQELLPADEQPASAEVPALQDAVNRALRNRPETELLRFEEEQNHVDLDYFRSQVKPQVDLVASYGRAGLAGKFRSGDNPLVAANRALVERVNALSGAAGLPPLAPPALDALPAFLDGGYGQALSNLFGRDFRTVEVGLEFQLPLRNREAQGNLGRAQADARRLTALRARLEQGIEAEVRNALQAVETARQRLEAARAARLAGREKLESETRLFAGGETTNFMVLTRQNEYSAARATELRASADWNKALANLDRALGTTLERHGLRMEPQM